MLKRLSAIILSILMVISAVPLVSAAETATPSFITDATTGLFAHGAVSSTDTEAWQMWQHEMQEENKEDREDKNMIDVNTDVKYFFMPSGSADNKAEIYNGFDTDVTINDTVIPAKGFAEVSYVPNESYSVSADSKTYTLIFKKSTAEAAIYINNPDADGNGTELYSYLSQNKENEASATAALVNKDGSVDNTSVKKIKGRGNTTWKKLKKPFNVTYNEKVSIDGMEAGKKFSLLANYQDGALIRNRLLYDLSDEVGMPYASDSRFADLYINGVYYGSYQIAQKIEVGSSDLINDIDDEAYLNADGTVAADFPFVMEIDPSASSDDYTVRTDNKTPITIKSPEIDNGETGYDEVKEYVKTKFTEMYKAITTTSTKEKLEAMIDIDSFSKLYLINELGKNWDVGVSSVYFTYKQDADGNWKFFASPVWDYDNSIGNALGVESDFSRMDLTQEDYLSPTGWWVQYKKYSASSSTFNIINRVARCEYLQKYSAMVWFKDFLPAIEKFSSLNVSEGELYSADVYYNYLVGTADCNYTRGWFLDTNPNWIADHTSLVKGTYDYETKQFVQDTEATTYEENFTGEYNYTVDWFTTRAAWLTAEFLTIGDTNKDGTVDENDPIIYPDSEPSESTSATEQEPTTNPTSPSGIPTEPTESTQPSNTEPTEPTEITVKAPKKIKAKIKSSKSIKVSWSKVANADGYMLYQRKANGKFKKIATTTAKVTSKNVKGLVSATRYAYKVKAFAKANGKTYNSAYSKIVKTITKPDKVTLKSVKANSPNAITIKWNKVKRAKGYSIYQKTASGYKQIASTGSKKNTVTLSGLNPNTKYKYKVKAFTKLAGKPVYGKASKVKSAKTSAATYNSKGYYKLYTNVPDFGYLTGASMVSKVYTYKQDGLTTHIYMYYESTVNKNDVKYYSETLLDCGFKYYTSNELTTGETIMYYTKNNTLVGLSTTQGIFCVAVLNL